MRRYILIRLLQMIGTLFVVSIVVFLLARASGDPLNLLMPMEATREDYQLVRQSLGLDKPLPTQYVIYLSRIVQGDFGRSIRGKKPVIDLINERLPNSAYLALVSMGLATLLGVPLGTIAAVKKGTATETLATVISLLGQSMPAFWLGIVLMLIFAVGLHWLPTSGVGSPLHYVMPAFTLGWYATAGIERLTRSSMIEVLDSEYVKLARTKGVPESRVIWVHALRNALIPVVTFTAVYFSLFIGAAVVVETIFNWPGLGSLAYDAVVWRDFPLIQGVVLVIAAIVMLVNLVADVLYAYIDPRVRY